MPETLGFVPPEMEIEALEVKREETRERILAALDGLSKWREEIPEQIVKTEEGGFAKFKCRNAWFSSVLLQAQEAWHSGLIPAEFIGEFAAAMKTFTDPDLAARLTTAEDIKSMNIFLNDLTSCLNNKD